MGTLEELLAKQEQTFRTIERSLINFKKLGQPKMTSATTQNRMTMLKEAFQQSQDQDAKIAACTDTQQKSTLPYFVGDFFTKYEEHYQEAMDYMAEILSKVTPKLEQASTNAEQSSTATSQSIVQLPRIQLPFFDGEFTDWESFRDRFISMVINNRSLSNVDRLHFLCSSLTGEANRAVSHLPITENNFEVAWKIIITRYENKPRLISTHLNTLFSLSPVTTETPHDLRTLRDNINTSLQMLRNLNRPVDSWSDLIVFLGVQKLDRASRKAWEFNVDDTTEYPTYSEFDTFLEKRIRALESIPAIQREKAINVDKNKQIKPKSILAHSTASTKITCPVCQQNHLIYQCQSFRSKTPSDRFNFIKQQKRCVNCFSVKHNASQCQSKHTCKECNQRHNTLLHFPKEQNSVPPAPRTNASTSDDSVEISSNFASNAPNNVTILLSTARIRVYSNSGRCVNARALLDQGSSATLITEHLAQSLRLNRRKQSTCITGIGEAQSIATHVADITITPAESNKPAYSTTAIILHSLTRYVPPQTKTKLQWLHLSGLNFADKEPLSSDPLDIIIGADLYGQLLLQGLRRGSECSPVAQNTTLGWILSGPYPNIQNSAAIGIHHSSVLENLDQGLRRFWELEDLPSPNHLSPEDQKCELHFKQTHSRTPSGRYVVRLPFKIEPPLKLGESRLAALNSLRSLENRLRNDSSISKEYREFLSDYESLGHMKKVGSPPQISREHYYIPHHAVIRESSTTTRLRVVFNASRRTSTGESLNDKLLTGPKLQQDLVAILLRWRQFQYVYTADIAKMYRQILVDSRDLDYQRILWRKPPLQTVSEYQLLTVTYGTAPAPYLALRVLQQLVEDEGSNFPLAVSILREQRYVDDFLFGSDDYHSLRQSRNQTIKLLAKGGFTLRKWASNDSSLLSDISPENHGLATSKSLQTDETISILGLTWNPVVDKFHFKLSKFTELPQTKRTILSTISKLFDPLGWISPIIIVAKIYLQSLWSIRCEWDDVLPTSLLNEWQKFWDQLPELEHLSVPRKISPRTFISQSLHGFSDASTKAYAAAVYSRTIHIDGSVSVFLIIAKTRVAPIKTVSVPRLELCAALLLARLINFTSSALKMPRVESHCWTDSRITLEWLSQSPNRWTTFVANRVAKVLELIPHAQWHHVPTHENPADCASRGVPIHQLQTHHLWWSGPQWLLKPSSSWPCSQAQAHPDIVPEEMIHIVTTSNKNQWDLPTRYSSWSKLLRVTAYILYFIQSLRTRVAAKRVNSLAVVTSSACKTPIILNPSLIQQARRFWLRRLQADAFPDEIKALEASKSVSKASPLLSLAPYLDSNGLIRAKGRLTNSQLSENSETPIILRSHPLLSLLIAATHRNLLHAGPRLTLACLRHEFWIIRARTTVRNVLYKCIACTRERAAVLSELMGDLPASRVTKVERPFIHTGVDYAGPIQIHTNSGRGHKSHKAYIAIFICLTVKAVHIELVSDYSSATFLAAYKRFVSRRGTPRSMYSDNGTTFQGANRELAAAFKAVLKNSDLGNQLATEGVEWHFMPPNAPHFGGLWEAAVKSIKFHLKRCIGAHTLTFEEMTTLLCRIEACLNSRPLGSISECIDDYHALTPGHFLISAPLITPPEPSVLELRDNRLSRWQLLQKITETFWKTWTSDYLQTLHQRPKWKIQQNLAKVGQLVILRNSTLPPSRWELGQIISCHPGTDGLVRVVTVKTANSVYKRPLSKLCFLPVSINTEHEKSTEPPHSIVATA